MTLTFLDMIFSVFILAIALLALINGFIKEIFGKLAVILGFISAFTFCRFFEPYVESVVHIPVVSIVLSFLLIFIVTFLLVKIIQMLAGAVFSGEIMKSLDRVLGFMFGVIEGLFLVGILLIIIASQPWFDVSAVIEKSLYWKLLLPFISPSIRQFGGMMAFVSGIQAGILV